MPAADRVGKMMRGAGHLVHMPAHIYQRVGRYADASEANRGGAESDLAYLAKTKPPGYYPMYLAHNFHFLAFAASYEVRYADALAAARQVAGHGRVHAVAPRLIRGGQHHAACTGRSDDHRSAAQ